MKSDQREPDPMLYKDAYVHLTQKLLNLHLSPLADQKGGEITG